MTAKLRKSVLVGAVAAAGILSIPAVALASQERDAPAATTTSSRRTDDPVPGGMAKMMDSAGHLRAMRSAGHEKMMDAPGQNRMMDDGH